MNLLILEIFLYQTFGLFIEVDPLQKIAVIPDCPFFDPNIGLEKDGLYTVTSKSQEYWPQHIRV